MHEESSTLEIFLRETARHQVRVRLDPPPYRRLMCKSPESGHLHFEVVTWPGCLAYVGDMGAYAMTGPAYQFFWCLYALVWAIREYDAGKVVRDA